MEPTQSLTDSQKAEMLKTRGYFPYRKITGVQTPDGEFHVFANPTFAQANNFARKNNGVAFRFD